MRKKLSLSLGFERVCGVGVFWHSGETKILFLCACLTIKLGY